MKRISAARAGLPAIFAAVVLVASLDVAAAQTKLFKSGTDEEAGAYYERISAQLGIAADQATLSDLIAYLGYAGVSARNLEVIEPVAFVPSTQDELDELVGQLEDGAAFRAVAALEDFSAQPVLAVRYLAPRIVDISGTPPYEAGWRKLVRLNALAGSRAEEAGIASGYILFNFLRAQDDPRPFPDADDVEERGAKSIQVMLMPRAGDEPAKDGAYFLLFEGVGAGYAAARFVVGDFDLPPDPKAEGRFYVPSACGRCHGDVGQPSNEGLRLPAAKLNFLDTDYWTDRIQPGDYFADAGALHGAIFDGGPDETASEFVAAFDAIRTLNSEIAEQNARAPVQTNDPNYQLQGVRKWQELHAQGARYAPPMERALGEADSRWSQDYPEDPPLVALLAKHCYRCHNTIDFNVLLKPRFAGVAKSSISSVMFGIMPFGHSLLVHEPSEADAIMDGLNKVLAQPTAGFR